MASGTIKTTLQPRSRVPAKPLLPQSEGTTQISSSEPTKVDTSPVSPVVTINIPAQTTSPSTPISPQPVTQNLKSPVNNNVNQPSIVTNPQIVPSGSPTKKIITTLPPRSKSTMTVNSSVNRGTPPGPLPGNLNQSGGNPTLSLSSEIPSSSTPNNTQDPLQISEPISLLLPPKSVPPVKSEPPKPIPPSISEPTSVKISNSSLPVSVATNPPVKSEPSKSIPTTSEPTPLKSASPNPSPSIDNPSVKNESPKPVPNTTQINTNQTISNANTPNKSATTQRRVTTLAAKKRLPSDTASSQPVSPPLNNTNIPPSLNPPSQENNNSAVNRDNRKSLSFSVELFSKIIILEPMYDTIPIMTPLHESTDKDNPKLNTSDNATLPTENKQSEIQPNKKELESRPNDGLKIKQKEELKYEEPKSPKKEDSNSKGKVQNLKQRFQTPKFDTLKTKEENTNLNPPEMKSPRPSVGKLRETVQKLQSRRKNPNARPSTGSGSSDSDEDKISTMTRELEASTESTQESARKNKQSYARKKQLTPNEDDMVAGSLRAKVARIKLRQEKQRSTSKDYAGPEENVNEPKSQVVKTVLSARSYRTDIRAKKSLDLSTEQNLKVIDESDSASQRGSDKYSSTGNKLSQSATLPTINPEPALPDPVESFEQVFYLYTDDFNMFTDIPWIIIDIGSRNTQIGLWDEGGKPRATIPSVICIEPNPDTVDWEKRPPRSYVGEDQKPGCKSFWPFKNGRLCTLSEWPKREDNTTPPPLHLALDNYFYHCIMNEIREDPQASAVIIPENYPLWTEETRQFIATILFQKVSVSAFCFVPTPITILAAVHKTSGIAIDFGASSIRICSVHKGIVCNPGNAKILPFGGNALVEWTLKEVKKKGFNISFQIAEDIVIKYSTVVMNYDSQKKTLKECLYDQNGIKIPLDSLLRCTGPEAIFTPSVAGLNGLGLIPAIKFVFYSCRPEFRSQLSNIVISGGLACLPQLKERLQLEISKVLPELQVISVPNPQIGSHFGTAILAQTGIAGATMDNYQERGVHCAWQSERDL